MAKYSPWQRMNFNFYRWLPLKVIESIVIFECKEGLYVPHEEEGVYAFNANHNVNRAL